MSFLRSKQLPPLGSGHLLALVLILSVDLWISVAPAPLWKTLNRHSSVSRVSLGAFVCFVQDTPTVVAGRCFAVFCISSAKAFSSRNVVFDIGDDNSVKCYLKNASA